MWTKLEVIELKNTGELKGGLSSRMTEPQYSSLCLRIRNDTIIKEQKEEKRIKKNEENTSDLLDYKRNNSQTFWKRKENG